MKKSRKNPLFLGLKKKQFFKIVSEKYYYHGTTTTCVVTVEMNPLVFAREGYTISRTGVATLSSDDEYDITKGDKVSNAKAMQKIYTIVGKLLNGLSCLCENKAEEFRIASQFFDSAATREQKFINNT